MRFPCLAPLIEGVALFSPFQLLDLLHPSIPARPPSNLMVPSSLADISGSGLFLFFLFFYLLFPPLFCKFLGI